MLAFFKTLVALGGRDPAAAQESVATLRRLANPQRRMDMWYLQFTESVMALLGNDLAASLDFARASIRTAAEMGMVYVHEFSLTLTAHVLARMGRDDDALQTAREAKSLVEESVIHNMAAEAMFVESYVALRRGDRATAVERARSAFEASRQTHYAFWFRFMPEVLPEVCSLALSEDIEPAYVGEVIRRYAIAPPRPFVRQWPWPLQISTLGTFAIVKAGVPIELTKSATRKPMELLKAIIALGVEGVSVAALIDHLWPDAEGDTAQKTFAITLHRLRRQLGDDHAVVMKAGTVGIDQRLCWVDVAAFERLTREGVVAGAPNPRFRRGVARRHQRLESPVPRALPCPTRSRSPGHWFPASACTRAFCRPSRSGEQPWTTKAIRKALRRCIGTPSRSIAARNLSTSV